jgi:type IV pilus assembly protein PilF
MRTIRALARALALAAAVGSLGCATTAQREQRELSDRKARSHYDLGVDHVHNGRIALALRAFLAAEKLVPEDPRVQYAIAEAYMRQGRLVESEAHLRRAIELLPDFHDARLSLTALMIEGKRYEEAIVESDRLLEDATFPAPWRALTNRGWAEFQLGRTVDARRTFQLAYEYDDGYWPTLLDLGILESQEGRALEAIGLFERLLQQRPGPDAEAEANYRLGEIYVSLGKRSRAMGYLMAAVAQTPEGRWGRKSEEYLKLLR